MRRLLISLAAVAMFVTATGCIAVSSKNNRFASDADVIAVDGRVYVVNKCTGAVRTVDLNAARPIVPGEFSEDDCDD